MLYFLEKPIKNLYGPGAVTGDIAESLIKKEDVILFANLWERAVEIEDREYKFIPEALEELKRFHIEVVKYGESLKS